MRKLAPLVFASLLATSQTGCLGSYSAFTSVHHWNEGATGSKPANSAIHFLLWVVPVYEIVLAGDFLIFNNIEFLSGHPVFSHTMP
jgi:hypothetical protein